MSKKIDWKFDIQVEEGPKIAESKSITVEAYDLIGVSVADGAAGEDVQVQPGGAGQVQVLIIKSNKYSTDLSYSVNAAEADPDKRIKLDGLQVFIGKEMVGLLDSAPQTLFFYNSMGETVHIQILVGRNATTP